MDIEHKKSHIAIICITPLLFAATVVFNYLAAATSDDIGKYTV